MKHVVLISSECTGKTTLAGQLAVHFGTTCSAEAVRSYLDRKGSILAAEDVEPIAREQIDLEDKAVWGAVKLGQPLVIHDTNLLSTRIYADHYYNYSADWVDDEVGNRLQHLYLLMDIDLPWKADGQRDRPDRRKEMYDLFEKELIKFGCDYRVISGSRQERFRNAVEIINKLIRE
jgi:nicotinamide riboside kinase